MEPPSGFTTDDGNSFNDTVDIEESDEEEEPAFVDIEEKKKRFREACEIYLNVDVPQDDIDQLVHRRIRQRLTEALAEHNNSKRQTDLRSYFQ